MDPRHHALYMQGDQRSHHESLFLFLHLQGQKPTHLTAELTESLLHTHVYCISRVYKFRRNKNADQLVHEVVQGLARRLGYLGVHRKTTMDNIAAMVFVVQVGSLDFILYST